MTTVAIMQPCYLPWRGYFALWRHADVLVHLDDVALPQGRTYQTRTSVKTASGPHWLTVPVAHGADRTIASVTIAHDAWRRKHASTLRQELPRASAAVADLLERPWATLADLNIALAERVADRLDVGRPTRRASELHDRASGSEHILGICRALGATRYVTAHGGRNYLDHERFDASGVAVRYLDYDLTPYPQPHGAFDPFVTALDALEHAPDPAACIDAALVPWRQFLEIHA